MNTRMNTRMNRTGLTVKTWVVDQMRRHPFELLLGIHTGFVLALVVMMKIAYDQGMIGWLLVGGLTGFAMGRMR